MSDQAYKGKTIIDLGKTKVERDRLGWRARWGVHFLYPSARGGRCELEFFSTLWKAKVAIDGDMENAL